MLAKSYPYYLGNEAVAANEGLAVTDKYTGEVATRVALADAAAIDRAIALAVEAAEPMRRLPAYQRQAVLQHCVKRFQERAEELAMSLCIEAGKPIKDSRGEVSRLIDTFRIAAEESVRITGEVMTMDIAPRPAATAACGSGCRSGRALSSRRSTSRSIWRRTKWRRRSLSVVHSC
jgi:acyl-CoA reductase-like NAD-dependent aldehyde dehydrogenase